MCFSPEVDLVAGVLVAAVGVDSLRQVNRDSERFLVALPIVLGVHQIVEALVWWGLDGTTSAAIGRTATWIYLAIAFGVIPVLVPLAVATLDDPANRRRLAVFATLGAAVTAVLVHALVRGPVAATIEGHHVAYRVDLPAGGLIVVLYVIATCGSLLASSIPRVQLFGAANLVAVAALAALDRGALISLWCAWAAVTSVAINLHLRSSTSPTRTALAATSP